MLRLDALHPRRAGMEARERIDEAGDDVLHRPIGIGGERLVDIAGAGHRPVGEGFAIDRIDGRGGGRLRILEDGRGHGEAFRER
jgi:hypothetical protein